MIEQLGAIVVQAIASAAVVLAAVAPLLISNRRKTVAASRQSTAAAVDAKEAITNGHEEHIRDTLDRFHRETTEAIAGVRTEVTGGRTEIINEMGGVKSDVRGIRRDIGRVVDRVTDLEKAAHKDDRAPGAASNGGTT